MEIRFYIEPETGHAHIYNHGVSETEVRQVMNGQGDDFQGRKNAHIKLGQTVDGRFLQVVYRADPRHDTVFVITAFDLRGKALKAYRRRQRRKRK